MATNGVEMSTKTKTETSEQSSSSESEPEDMIELDTKEIIKKSKLTKERIEISTVKCSACSKQLNHLDRKQVKKHPTLGVIVCTSCFDFYGDGMFSEDEDSTYKYCRWCAQGGHLFACDFCKNVFCIVCIRRNFGRSETTKVETSVFKCYVCDSSKLKPKVNYCDAIVHYSLLKRITNKKTKKKSEDDNIDKLFEKLRDPEVIEPKEWLEAGLSALLIRTKKFQAHIEKMRYDLVSKGTKESLNNMDKVSSYYKHQIRFIMDSTMQKSKLYSQHCVLKNTEKTIANASSPSPTEANNVEPATTPEIQLVDDGHHSDDPMDCIQIEKELVETPVNSDIEEKIADNELVPDSVVEPQPESELPDTQMVRSESIESQPETDSLSCSSPASSDSLDTGSILEIIKKEQQEDKPRGFSVQKIKKKASKTKGFKLNMKITKPTLKSSSSEIEEHDDSSSDAMDFVESVKIKKMKALTSQKVDIPPHCFAAEEVAKWNIDKENLLKDPKLKAKCFVVLGKLPDLGKFVEPVKRRESLASSSESNSELDVEDKVDIEVLKLCNFEEKSPKKKLGADPEILKIPVASTSKVKEKKKRRNSALETSDDNVDCSSEDSNALDELIFGKVVPEMKNGAASSSSSTSCINLNSDESGADEQDDEKDKMDEKEKKKKVITTVIISDDDDDFVPVRRKKHGEDKYLSVPLEEAKTKANKAKNEDTGKKTKKKRKRGVIDSSSEDKSSNSSDSSSDSSKEKKKKQKRRRIKVQSSSDDSDNEDKKEKEVTPQKGRKNIRKVMSDKKVTETTREAQEAEKDRRNRIEARQKLYNQIVDRIDENIVITRKLVLETDPESKEELVEIDMDIIEKLKPHQINGVKFMWESTIESLKDLKKKPGSGCILAHCMGLGKTLQVIAFLQTVLVNERTSKHLTTALVVCPYNTVLNWGREFEYWLEGVENPIQIYDMSNIKSNRDRRDCLKNWMDDGGVMILGYTLFQRLMQGKLGKCSSQLKKAITRLLTEPGPDIVVCDEGHLLKNENSSLAQAANSLRTRRRIVLTGTPLQNNMKEYYCMMSFVKPNLLGTYREFLNRFVNPISNGQYDNSSRHDVKLMQKRVHILHKLLEGCVQRCDYSALCKFLPQKHEYVISVKLSEVQIKLYRHYLDHLARGRGDKKMEGGSLFQDYSALRNIWTFPYNLQLSYERNKWKPVHTDSEGEASQYGGSFIDDRSSSDLSSMEEDVQRSPNESEKENKGKKRKKNDSSDEEVIKTYTRLRCAVGENSNEPEEEKEWYHQFMPKEDKFKFEMSGKMILLLDILNECQKLRDKILVFSQSLLTLDMIEDVLTELDSKNRETTEENADVFGTWVKHMDYFRIDGKVNVDLRKQCMDKFNDLDNERARLILISTRAGSLGTNLIGANRVILLDASWNPSHDVQAIFRVYRFGQLKPVYVYRFLAQGTMEEKIYDRQVTKLSLASRVVDEQHIDRHFNSAELSELYKFEPDSRTERPTPMVPKDRLLADLLIRHGVWIVTYHEHDSLLQNSMEDNLTEEERQAAWTEYENEKEGVGNFNFPDVNMQQTWNASTQKPSIGQDMLNIQEQLKRLNLPPLEETHRLLIEYEQLRIKYLQAHVSALRHKQEMVSKQIPISAVFSQNLQALTHGLATINIVLASKKQEYDAKIQHINMARQSNMGQNFPRYSFQAPFGAQNFARMHNYFQGMGQFNVTVSRQPVPKQSPTPTQNRSVSIEEISSTTSGTPAQSGNNSSPIITEVEEISQPKSSSANKNGKSSVEIMEID